MHYGWTMSRITEATPVTYLIYDRCKKPIGLDLHPVGPYLWRHKDVALLNGESMPSPLTACPACGETRRDWLDGRLTFRAVTILAIPFLHD